jgi:hypothetical protein
LTSPAIVANYSPLYQTRLQGFPALSMKDFVQIPLREFLIGERDDDNLWLFVHVPKTAGTSFSHEMAREMPPYRNIHVDYENPDLPYEAQLQAAVDRFIDDARETAFRSASGHITAVHAQQIYEAIPTAKLITFLRDPVARVISDYRYQRTPAHPPYQKFIEQFPTLEDYIEFPDARNKIFRFLVPNHRTPIADAVAQIEESFTFVGLVEMYPMSFNVTFRLFGLNPMPVEHQRKTETNEFNIYEDSPELRARIRKLNELDVVLFEHFRSILVEKRAEWLAIREEEQVK